MEKKPVTVKPKKTAGSTPVAPPKTAKDRSVMEEPAKSRMSAVKSVKKLSKKSQREEAVTTDKTQSEPHGKVHAEIVEKTQMETVDDTDVAKTQGEDARTNASISVKNKKRDLVSFEQLLLSISNFHNFRNQSRNILVCSTDHPLSPF